MEVTKESMKLLPSRNLRKDFDIVYIYKRSNTITLEEHALHKSG